MNRQPALVLVSTLLAVSGFRSVTTGRGQHEEDWSLGLPALIPPADNPITPAKVALGRKLFFDKRLSSDNSVSCATCHDPNAGFADPHPSSVGVKARRGERNSSTVLNSGFAPLLMWDGKASSLESQAILPFLAHSELDLHPEEAATKLRQQGYSSEFQDVFGDDVSPVTIAKALATYQRTLAAGDSPFDRFLFRKESQAISLDARRGFEVFLSAKCDGCHLIMTEGLHPFGLREVMFTDDKFHNVGVGVDKASPDVGRFEITGEDKDWAAFRTPSLRNVAVTAPYFHDGSAASLEDVVEFYDKGGLPNRNLDPAIKPLKLTPEQKANLVRYLESLTSAGIPALARQATRLDRD
jgi:cytochrome c peroxidase